MLAVQSEFKFTTKENEILDDYCMFQTLYNFSRQKFKKETVTPYNKEQKKLKGNPIHSYHLLLRDYPKLVDYYSKLYNISDLSLLFESNFTKLIKNTFLIPSFQLKTYGTRQYKSYASVGEYSSFVKCYKEGDAFINKINQKVYTLNKHQQLVDKDGNIFSLYNIIENMYLFSES